LQGRVRDRRAGYRQSLGVLEAAKRAQPGVVTKSSIMLGVGERPGEVRQAMQDLLAAGVEVLTLGQYLRPSKGHMPVAEYVAPEAFEAWRAEGEAMGFAYVASGPLVRSSYKAGGTRRAPPLPCPRLTAKGAEFFLKAMLRGRQGTAVSDLATQGPELTSQTAAAHA
ncbi:MAG: hypothetical protein ACK4ZJ_16195, partial [Allorhizobium sp.]